MATLTLNNADTSKPMQLRMTYTENGSTITLTKVECRCTDSYRRYDLPDGIGYLNGTQLWTSVDFPANSVWATNWTGSYAAPYSGKFTLYSPDVSSLRSASFSYSITPSTHTLTLNTSTGVASFTGGGTYNHGAVANSTCKAATGYTLSNYQGTTADGSSTSTWTTSAGQTTHTTTWTMNANRTITAYATANTYTITYNANGGTGAPAAHSYTYAPTGTTKLSSTVPTRTGYTFLGWSLSSTATTASYSAGQNWNLNNASNYTLYAVWSINKYYLDVNGLLDGSAVQNTAGYGTFDVYINGTLVSDNVTDYYTEWPYGTTYEIKGVVATTGHTYNGVSAGSASGTITGTKSVQLNFTTNTYTVTYNANGGTGAPASQTKYYAATLTLSSTKPTRTGYTFLHWNTKSDGTGTSYAPGSAYGSESNVTLYAIWRRDTVNYKQDGAWVEGFVYVKENGAWVKGKLYVKSNGSWTTN